MPYAPTSPLRMDEIEDLMDESELPEDLQIPLEEEKNSNKGKDGVRHGLAARFAEASSASHATQLDVIAATVDVHRPCFIRTESRRRRVTMGPIAQA